MLMERFPWRKPHATLGLMHPTETDGTGLVYVIASSVSIPFKVTDKEPEPTL